MSNNRPLVWLHGGSLSCNDPAMRAQPNAPAIFVFDREFLSHNAISFARLQFIFEAALEALVGRTKRVVLGVQATEIAAFAREQGCNIIHTTFVASPELDQTRIALETLGFTVVFYDTEYLTSFRGRVKRFSGFWKQVEHEVWQ
jgi:hypothetical protein